MVVLLLLGIMAAFWIQRILYETCWNKKLDVTIQFQDPYVYEGEHSSLKEEICNDKYLPLPALEVRIAISRSLQFLGEAKENTNVTDLTYKRDVFSLLWRQKLIRTLPFLCQKRGFYQIGQAELVGSDFFFEKEYYLTSEQQTQMYVYPAQIDVRRINQICRAISGMVLTQNRLYPDPFEFSGIREYHPTDPMNHINWKASAKSAGLMVNQFDSTTDVRVRVVLDVEDSGILKEDALTEESIRIAASLAARMMKGTMEVHLLGNAVYVDPESEKAQEELLSMHLKAGSKRLQELNRRLACVEVKKTNMSIVSVLKEEQKKDTSGKIYVLISKNQTEEVYMAAKQIAEKSEFLWILPVYPSKETGKSSNGKLRIMQWEVEIC